MNITKAQLKAQVESLSDAARKAVRKATEGHPHVDEPLLLAMMSRETGMKNIVGDGGHGRGGWQQDDRYLGPWLKSVKGCDSGKSTPKYDSAFPKGHVPTITDGARKCAQLIEANVVEVTRQKVRFGSRLKVAVSAYNAGLGGAMEGYNGYNDSDHFTTGRDYAADVLARRNALKKLL